MRGSSITLTGGDAGHPGAQLGACVTIRGSDIAQQVERLAELLNGLLGVAVEQGDLAKSMGERGKRLRLAGRAGDTCQCVGAGARVSISGCRCEEADRPA